MQIRIEASDLPGRTPRAGGGAGDVHVGVQRKNRPGEVLDLVPGDAPSATWTLECSATAVPGGLALNGPCVQNGLGGRFVYLSWGTMDESARFTMFRRAKLMLDDIGSEIVEAAVDSGCLVGRLRLTDAAGGPVCGAVRPPLIDWSAA